MSGLAPSFRDHPRLRGEKFSKYLLLSLSVGSPPLARGKVGARTMIKFRARITPACAGKRMCSIITHRRARDHPRLRGEKAAPANPSPKSKGSPPLARGKGGRASVGGKDARITPACAGKSWRAVFLLPRRKDHPRLRGEKFLSA